MRFFLQVMQIDLAARLPVARSGGDQATTPMHGPPRSCWITSAESRVMSTHGGGGETVPATSTKEEL